MSNLRPANENEWTFIHDLEQYFAQPYMDRNTEALLTFYRMPLDALETCLAARALSWSEKVYDPMHVAAAYKRGGYCGG